MAQKRAINARTPDKTSDQADAPVLKAKPERVASVSKVRDSIMARTQKVRAYLAAN